MHKFTKVNQHDKKNPRQTSDLNKINMLSFNCLSHITSMLFNLVLDDPLKVVFNTSTIVKCNIYTAVSTFGFLIDVELSTLWLNISERKKFNLIDKLYYEASI